MSNSLLAYTFFLISMLENFGCSASSGCFGVIALIRVNCPASDFRDCVKLAREGLFTVDVHCHNLALDLFLKRLHSRCLSHPLLAQSNPFMRSCVGHLAVQDRDLLDKVVQLGHLGFDDIAGVVFHHGENNSNDAE